MFTVKLTTGLLTRDQVLDEIKYLENLAANRSTVKAMLGWACKLPQDDLWRYVSVESSQIRDWIDDKIKAGIYDPGSSDLYLGFPDGSEFLFCHESDVHVESDDRDLLRVIAKRWLEKGYRVNYAIFGDKWQPVASVSELV
jgi:hypothetical protein